MINSEHSQPYELTRPTGSDHNEGTRLEPLQGGPLITSHETGEEVTAEQAHLVDDSAGAELIAPRVAAATVRTSADFVVARLPGQERGVQQRTLVNLTTALSITESSEAARTFAKNQFLQLDMRPSETLIVWSALYRAGDQAALNQARQIAAFAPAELAIPLVEAGDQDIAAAVRSRLNATNRQDKTELFGRLYAAGDTESLDLALAADTQAVTAGIEEADHSEKALVAIGDAAVSQGRLVDALRVVSIMRDEGHKAALHAALFANGHEASLSLVLGRMEEAPDIERQLLERTLAAAGYGPALNAVQQRVAAHTARVPGQLETGHLEDLIALHAAGLVQSESQFAAVAYRRQGGFVEHPNTAASVAYEEVLAARLYYENPNVGTAIRLLNVGFQDTAWKSAFGYFLENQHDPETASSLVRMLAIRARERANRLARKQ